MSGINGSDPRFISPTNDFNRSGGEGTINVNVQPNMNELANRTSQRIFQVASESPESSELICSSAFRVSGTPFTFTSDIGGPLFRPRILQLRNTIMPRIPNINRQNNEICIQLVNGTIVSGNYPNPVNIQFTMPVGFYTPDTFRNDFVLLLRDAIIAQAPGQRWTVDSTILSIDDIDVTGQYDYDTGRFSIDINLTSMTALNFLPPIPIVQNGDHMFHWWFPNDCPFITKGRNFIHFVSTTRQPILPELGGVITPFLTVPTWSPPSSPALTSSGPKISLMGASFIYTRYVTVVSQALSLYAFGVSKVDKIGNGGGTGKIIGVISTSSFYQSNLTYHGMIRTNAVDSSSVGIKNSQLKLNELLDFEFLDEYGESLDLAFPEDNDWGPTLAFIISY